MARRRRRRPLAKTMPADYRVSITNAPGPDFVSDLELHLAADPEAVRRPGEGRGGEGFLDWMLDHGESEAAAMGYAPLPAQVRAMEKKTIATIK